MLKTIIMAVISGLFSFLKNWLTANERDQLKSEAAANAEGKASVGPSLEVEEKIRDGQEKVVEESGDEKETPNYTGWNSGN